LTYEITELKQPPETVVERARDLTDMHFHLELTVRMGVQIADCVGAFDNRKLHTLRVWHSSGVFDRVERESNQINSDLEGFN